MFLDEPMLEAHLLLTPCEQQVQFLQECLLVW
jgi:hypothetical protein